MTFLNALLNIKNPKPNITIIELIIIQSLAVVFNTSPSSNSKFFKLWSILGNTTKIDSETWPVVDKDALVEDEITIVIQINGKVRARINIDPNLDEESVIAKAKECSEVTKFTDGKQIKKTIYVKGRLVNIVAI